MKRLPNAGRAQTESQRPKHSQRTAALIGKLDAMPGAVAKPLSARTPSVLIYKVMGKMFAILSIKSIENVIFKCDPILAHVLRKQYAGVGHRSHLDRRYWISVSLNADVPTAEVERLVEHSYGLVCSTLTREQKAELAALTA
jgi:predicted DNA-binding protein (MmcQ/YjbR family)